MSAPGTPAPPTQRPLVWRIVQGVLIAGALSLLFLFLFAGFESLLVDFGSSLIAGWWFFLVRTLPAIRFNWDLWGMAALCAVLFVAGAQRFLAWLTQTVARRRGTTWTWPWRWTWCGSAALAIFFAVGMSVGGIVHQLGWMASSREPMLEQDGHYFERRDMRQLAQIVMLLASKPDATLAGLRVEAMNPDGMFHPLRARYKNEGLLASFQVLLILEPNGRVSGAIVHPRDVRLRALVGGCCLVGENTATFTAGQLDQFIKERQSRLIAL